MRTGLTKREKTTDIWFDEKDPLIHIRTHNTDLKKRLAAYAGQHPDQCRQTDADPETGCMEFEIAKGASLSVCPPHPTRNGGKLRSGLPEKIRPPTG